MTNTRIIDVHNHFYPPEYLTALKSKQSVVKVTTDKDANLHIHYPGDYNVAVAGHRPGPEVQPCFRIASTVEQPLTIT